MTYDLPCEGRLELVVVAVRLVFAMVMGSVCVVDISSTVPGIVNVGSMGARTVVDRGVTRALMTMHSSEPITMYNALIVIRGLNLGNLQLLDTLCL